MTLNDWRSMSANHHIHCNRCKEKALKRLLLPVLLIFLYSISALATSKPQSGRHGVDGFRDLPAVAVAPDLHFNSLFTRSEGGWTGGDGTYSVALPDGRTVWMFGDSFLGRIMPDGSRPIDTPLVNNCFVVQNGTDMKTLHGGSAGAPRALVAPGEGGDGFYWPGDGMIENNHLRVFFNRFIRTGDGPWQWRWIATEVAGFSLPDLVEVSVTRLKNGGQVAYGAAVFESGRHVYVYGTKALEKGGHAHVARFSRGSFSGRWHYFSGRDWRPDPEASGRVLTGVANQFSVIEAAGGFLLITTDNRKPFDSTIVAYASPSPVGPWRPAVRVYEPPEADGVRVAYNALAHPQFTVNGRLLISYNVNTIGDAGALYEKADIYRPRFIRLKLAAVAECLYKEAETIRGDPGWEK